jgi:hypothetical protein
MAARKKRAKIDHFGFSRSGRARSKKETKKAIILVSCQNRNKRELNTPSAARTSQRKSKVKKAAHSAESE